MIKEQAIDIIKCLAWHGRPEEEKIEQAIKALEQQPSDDCVSRKDVLEMFGYETAIYDLPPVTPTFPEGATNGDMIKAMFPNANLGTLAQDDIIVNRNYSNNDDIQVSIPIKWWNAPYKGVEK